MSLVRGPRLGPVEFAAVQTERTVAGDLVSTRRATFRSQQDQILFLRKMIDRYRGLAAIRARARDIVFRLFECEPRNEVAYALAIATWVQRNVTYVRELPEEFQTPTATISMGYGDCDDMAVAIGALVSSLGIEIELVGMSWRTPTGPGGLLVDGFGHIFCRAVVKGQRVPLDATLELPIEEMTDPVALGQQRGLVGLHILVA